MNYEFEKEIIGQLAELRIAAQKVSELDKSISKATDELSNSGNIAKMNLDQLKEISVDTARALNSLLGATNFLDELRQSSEPSVKAIVEAIKIAEKTMSELENRSKSLIIDATNQFTQLSQNVSEKLSHVPVVLDDLDNSGRNLLSQIADLTKTISDLNLVMNYQPDDSNEKHGLVTFNQRLDLALPAALIGFCIGVFGFRLGIPESITWIAITFTSILAGLSARNIFDRVVTAITK